MIFAFECRFGQRFPRNRWPFFQWFDDPGGWGSMRNRVGQLDSIRGLAALSVYAQHMISVQGALPFLLGTAVVWSPLKILHNGHGAVTLFFVLSGFVLSAPFFEKKEAAYFPYLIRRVFRIYFPYLMAILLSLGLKSLAYAGNKEDLSAYFNLFWSTPVHFNLIAEHVLFLGNIRSAAINNVIWSLIQELRISLIFPFVCVLVARLSLKANVAFCFLLTAAGGSNNLFQFQIPNGNYTTYFDTLRFLSIFIFGALLAKHREACMAFFTRLPLAKKALFLVLSLFCYTYSDLAVSSLARFLLSSANEFTLIGEYGAALGTIGIMTVSMGSTKAARFLTNRIFLFLGKISYSLYLCHLPVLVACIYLLDAILPIGYIYLVSFPAVLAVSALFWYLVERPSMEMGRKLAAKINAKPFSKEMTV